MTYEANETSVESGRPVELYLFTRGATNTRYTSAEDTVSFGGSNYLPRQISRSDLSQTSDEKAIDLEVNLPADDPIASDYIGIVPAVKLQLTITRFHRGDASGIVIWKGRVLGAGFKDNGRQAILRCVTEESAVSRPMPYYKYQGLCNHVLYNTNCQAVKASFSFLGTASSPSGNDITVAGLEASKGAGWAVGGYVEFGDDRRLVLAQSGDVLTLLIPFAEDEAGASVTVYAGCNHSPTTCDSKFSNIVNYGGFPFVPTKNPFNVGLG